MKKSLIFVGLLAIGFANAQEGNVGINTSLPKATLDIQPSAENAKVDATTNQGIIIPKLTKARVAAIASGNLVEGTKVYVTDEVTAADTQFIGIGKGFYFYNGTKWVKQLASDTDTNSELWEQTTENGETKTYLKASKGTVDIFGFIDRGTGKGQQYAKILGETSFDKYPRNIQLYTKQAPIYSFITSKALPLVHPISTSAFYNFHNITNVIEPTHVANSTSTSLRYNGGNVALRIYENLGKTVNYMNGQSFSAVVGDADGRILNQNVGDIVGLQGSIDLFTTGTVTTAQGLVVANNNHEEANIHNFTGARIGANNHKGTIRNMDGLIVTSYLNGGSVTNVHRGINAVSSTASGLAVKSGSGITNRYIHSGIIEGEYIGVYNSFEPQKSEATVGSFYGYRLNLDLSKIAANTEGKKLLATNAYGLHMDDVNFASGENYAIYTKAGQVRVGDLTGSGDRVVYADSNGVLKTGSANITATNGLQNTENMECNPANRGKMNFIQGADGKSDVFGICMKNKDGNYYWGYMVGGNNPTNGSGIFGSGL